MNMQHRVCVTIYPLDGDAPFDLVFYGIPWKDFMVVPGGADPIHAALKKRGLNPRDFTSSPFFVRCMSQHEAQPPHEKDRDKEGRARAYEWRDRRGHVHKMEQPNG